VDTDFDCTEGLMEYETERKCDDLTRRKGALRRLLGHQSVRCKLACSASTLLSDRTGLQTALSARSLITENGSYLQSCPPIAQQQHQSKEQEGQQRKHEKPSPSLRLE
jgi:hypothetical protein